VLRVAPVQRGWRRATWLWRLPAEAVLAGRALLPRKGNNRLLLPPRLRRALEHPPPLRTVRRSATGRARPMPRLGLLPRRLHVWYCAAVVYLLIKATQRLLALRRRLRGTADAGDDPVERRCWSRTHTCCARRIVQVAIKRGALWLKFAQYCTSRADVLPDEYLAVLDRCLDSAAPMPPAVVSAAVRAELGGSDVHEVFDGFDATAPIASASIAQVHRCVLRASGAPVVLKVQRPGVRELLLQDLRDLDRILTLVAGAEPEFDFRPMLQAWMDMVPLECNFLAETASSNFVAGALDDARGTEFATTAFVPAVLPEYTTERLMCIDYIDVRSERRAAPAASRRLPRAASRRRPLR
jgi:predicted unusual protein kinase regulating ubiquinone biosynthesis (AarF/ABC1/UbiB family)